MAFVAPEYELAPEYQEPRWTRPTPPLPAAVVGSIFELLMRKKHTRGVFEDVLRILRKARCPADLINESFVHWLFVSTDPLPTTCHR